MTTEHLTNTPIPAETVEFYGHDIFVCMVEEKPHVLIKSICDAIGINPDSAVRGLKNDDILGAEHTVRYVRVPSGQVNKFAVLPTEYVQGWLFSISTSKVKPEIVPELLRFKRECYSALTDYFSGNVAKHRKITEMEKALVSENRSIDQAVRFLKSRFNFNKNTIEDIREQRFVAYRLFEDLETKDDKLKEIFAMVERMQSEPHPGLNFLDSINN